MRVIEWRSERARDRARAARAHAPARRCTPTASRRAGSPGRCAAAASAPRLPLVLLHGFTGTGEFWLPVAQGACRAGAASSRTCPDTAGRMRRCRRRTGAWTARRTRWRRCSMRWRSGASRSPATRWAGGSRSSLALRHPERVAALALIGASARHRGRGRARGARGRRPGAGGRDRARRHRGLQPAVGGQPALRDAGDAAARASRGDAQPAPGTGPGAARRGAARLRHGLPAARARRPRAPADARPRDGRASTTPSSPRSRATWRGASPTPRCGSWPEAGTPCRWRRRRAAPRNSRNS